MWYSYVGAATIGGEMERLKVSIGKTYNIGNYESVRLDVGLEADVSPTKDSTLEQIFDSMMFDVVGMLHTLEIERKVVKK